MIFDKVEELNPNIMKIIYQKARFRRLVQLMIGLLLVAISFNVLVMPSNIIYGVSGIGVMLKRTYSLDPSTIILLTSIFLLILSYFTLGKEKTLNTAVGSILYPVFVKLTEWIPNYIDFGNTEPVVIALFGAVVTGLGLGLIFKAGYTTGGTDILNHIVSKYGKISVGTAMYLTDGLIIFVSYFVLGFQCFVYSVISLYIISILTDKVILGISQSKTFYIITEHETSIKKFLLMNLCHGLTVLDGRGGYTGNNKKVIMCIVPTKEYFVVKEGIKDIDPEAFFLVTDAYEVAGGE